MQTSANRIYLDSSAIVKLVIRESETDWRLAPNIAVVTYDHRLRDAAQALGLPVVAPAP